MPSSVIIAIPVLMGGGTEMHTLNLVEVLVSAGHQVKVCCYYEVDMTIVLKFEKAGAKVILMKLNRSCSLLYLTRKLRALFKNIKPDIVHVQYIAPGLVPIIAAKSAGMKCIFATVHQPGRPYGWKEKILIRSAARLCNAFFCVSQAAEKTWFGDSEILDPQNINRNRKHFTVYNGVDTSRVEKLASTADSNEIKMALNINGKKVIGVIGRLRKEKGQRYLLEAFKYVLQKVHDAVLVIVGEGPDKDYLMYKAEELGLRDKIIWLGYQSQNDLYKLYGIMNVLAVPSEFEGFGLTAAEGMAAKLPIVASRVDGLTEVIEDNTTGYLVSAGASNELAGALLKLISNPEKAVSMGFKGRERVKKVFPMERFNKSIITAYQYFNSHH